MIELFVKDILNALKNKCYFSALALALALPDICGGAEYPNEISVARRYIGWFDKYLGEYMSNEEDALDPFLSGEVIYNLRNTYLHTGSPNINSQKIKNEVNQIDYFMLILGDGKVIWSTSILIDTPIVKTRSLLVDVTYLCKTIINCSLWYYKQNKDKFKFDFSIITQDDLLSDISLDDLIINDVNKKLKQSGYSLTVSKIQEHSIIDTIKDGYHFIHSDEELKKFLNGEKISLVRENAADVFHVKQPERATEANKQLSSDKETKSSSEQKKINPDKREAQVRSFFGQHFKEKKYKQKKEIIIQTIIKSSSKQQVNNSLMKSFTSKETGVIYKRIAPLIVSLPGR